MFDDSVLEFDELLIKYFNSCNFVSVESDIISIVFTDTTTTLIQVIESYRYGQFVSEMAIVGSARDAASYASITLRPIYDRNLEKSILINPIDGIIGYKRYKKLDIRMNKIINKGFLTHTETAELFKIRNNGNFSGHYFKVKKGLF